MSRVYFPAVIEAGREGYGVFFPDLDGLASGGDTVQQAALNAEEGLRAHIELMAEEGLEIPKASELDAVKVDPDIKEVARILVGVDLPSSNVLRLNVTLPEDLVKRIDAASNNRSGFLAQAARLALHRKLPKLRIKPARKTNRKVRIKPKPAKKRTTA
ncbi:MAG: type II toxin-antitoxin system HicB family antitoxin [Stellaceae bacterium]